MSYIRTYRVKTWIIVEPGDKAELTLKYLGERGGLNQEYPSLNFSKKIEELKGRGYHHLWENPNRVILPPDFLMRAASEHVKDLVGSSSQLTFNNALFARIDRQIKGPEDLVRIMDEVLAIQPDINLSQAFQVKERCHREGANNYSVFFSMGPANKSILQRLADTVITIGESEGSDINIKEVKPNNLKKFLLKYSEGGIAKEDEKTE